MAPALKGAIRNEKRGDCRATRPLHGIWKRSISFFISDSMGFCFFLQNASSCIFHYFIIPKKPKCCFCFGLIIFFIIFIKNTHTNDWDAPVTSHLSRSHNYNYYLCVCVFPHRFLLCVLARVTNHFLLLQCLSAY